MENGSTAGWAANTVKLLDANSFAGVSLGAYKRLLKTAIETVASSRVRDDSTIAGLTSSGIPPHLARIYLLWAKQQRIAMGETSELFKRRKDWIKKRHKIFGALRGRLGDSMLDSMFRVSEDGSIIFSRLRSEIGTPTLSNSEVEACLSMYSFYTLVLGAPSEIKSKLAEALAKKLS